MKVLAIKSKIFRFHPRQATKPSKLTSCLAPEPTAKETTTTPLVAPTLTAAAATTVSFDHDLRIASFSCFGSFLFWHPEFFPVHFRLQLEWILLLLQWQWIHLLQQWKWLLQLHSFWWQEVIGTIVFGFELRRRSCNNVTSFKPTCEHWKGSHDQDAVVRQ